MSHRHQKLTNIAFTRTEQGAALILFAVLLVLVATTAFFIYFDSNGYKIERERRTFQALAEAKSALIGWSVAHPQYPGILPFPDRGEDAGGYDGNSDCTNPVLYSHLLGKLPYVGQTLPCIGSTQYGLASDLVDGHGERLWYAVSKNLIRATTATGSLIINPAIVDTPTDWLIVRDKSGQIISDRVAAVIIAPGPVIGTQNRAGGLAGPAAYLDTVTIGGTVYSNAVYTEFNRDFIMGEDMQNVSDSHPDYQQPYEFNDKLIYITIDELMEVLEKRAIREAAAALRDYYLNSVGGFYPYAAVLGVPDNVCEEGVLMGGLPISNVGSNCEHPNPGLSMPTWFTESSWQDYLYYAVSSDCSFATPGCITGGITSGTKTNVHALLISAGRALPGQVRPSSNAADYLDSVENANGDTVFDAVGMPRTAVYNDQILIVAP